MRIKAALLGLPIAKALLQNYADVVNDAAPVPLDFSALFLNLLDINNLPDK